MTYLYIDNFGDDSGYPPVSILIPVFIFLGLFLTYNICSYYKDKRDFKRYFGPDPEPNEEYIKSVLRITISKLERLEQEYNRYLNKGELFYAKTVRKYYKFVIKELRIQKRLARNRGYNVEKVEKTDCFYL